MKRNCTAYTHTNTFSHTNIQMVQYEQYCHNVTSCWNPVWSNCPLLVVFIIRFWKVRDRKCVREKQKKGASRWAWDGHVKAKGESLKAVCKGIKRVKKNYYHYLLVFNDRVKLSYVKKKNAIGERERRSRQFLWRLIEIMKTRNLSKYFKWCFVNSIACLFPVIYIRIFFFHIAKIVYTLAMKRRERERVSEWVRLNGI